jgi:hypothetical protein
MAYIVNDILMSDEQASEYIGMPHHRSITPLFAMWRIKQTAESRFIVERRWWYWPMWTDAVRAATPIPPRWQPYPYQRPITTLDEARTRLAELKGKRKMEPRYWYE